MMVGIRKGITWVIANESSDFLQMARLFAKFVLSKFGPIFIAEMLNNMFLKIATVFLQVTYLHVLMKRLLQVNIFA